MRAVLTGSLKQVGDQIVINVSLDDTLDGRHIWGAQYDRKASDLLAVQRDIARDITGNLRLKLSGADEQKVTKDYPANEEAYQAYLKGRYYYQHFTEESETKAIERFNEAITLDPNYAQAFAGLALVYTRISAAYLPPSEAMPKAKQAVLKALALDGSLADAHLALAEIHWWNDWDFPAAEEEFKRAIELSPNEPSAYSAYAMFMAGTLGRADEAIAQVLGQLTCPSASLPGPC